MGSFSQAVKIIYWLWGNPTRTVAFGGKSCDDKSSYASLDIPPSNPLIKNTPKLHNRLQILITGYLLTFQSNFLAPGKSMGCTLRHKHICSTTSQCAEHG